MQLRYLLAAVLGWCLLSITGASWAWTINDSYDSQNVGDRCGSFWADNADSTVSTAMSVSGNKSCLMRIAQGNAGWGGGFVFPGKLRRYDEYWMRFRLFVPNGFDWNVTSGGDKLKFIRITTKDSGGAVARLDWQWKHDGSNPSHAKGLERDNCTTDCWEYFGGANDAPVRGTWETWEIYAKFDTVSVNNGGQGRVRAWKNGKLIGDLTNRKTMVNASDTVEAAMIFSYWNGTSPKSQEVYMDDLVATNITPLSSDSNGNRYIGVGSFVATAAPLPPSGIN